MRNSAAASVLLLSGLAFADVILINGASAALPSPRYPKWFSDSAKLHPAQKFNAQPTGSGGGVKQIVAMTVAFGATGCKRRSAPGQCLPRSSRAP